MPIRVPAVHSSLAANVFLLFVWSLRSLYCCRAIVVFAINVICRFHFVSFPFAIAPDYASLASPQGLLMLPKSSVPEYSNTRSPAFDEDGLLRMTDQHLESRAQPRTLSPHNLVIPETPPSSARTTIHQRTTLVTLLIPPLANVRRPERRPQLLQLRANLVPRLRQPGSFESLLI